ncbi:MAG: GNAT family N-acetyltransferase [Wenzhouxiangellaceae bacterium]
METMEQQLTIRPARSSELSKLAELMRGRLPDLMRSDEVPETLNVKQRLNSLLPDQALLLAIDNRQLSGMAALDLDHANVLALYLDPNRARAETARKLLEDLEQVAMSYGIRRLHCSVKPQAWAFMERMGYQAVGESVDGEPIRLSKPLADHFSPHERKIADLHQELGIPTDYGVSHRLKLIEEARGRVSVGMDLFNRDVELARDAADAWKLMRENARNHNIDLLLVSGYRSIEYQANLFRKKLDQDMPVDRILRTTAAPGYSEHHSGMAIDLSTYGVRPLERDFAMTRAYEWLKSHARIYGFHESYPKNNRHRIEWEPWHWCYRGTFSRRR